MKREVLREALIKALEKDVPYYQAPLPSQGTLAAVLIVFGYSKDSSQPQILFTRRTEHVEKHKGQIAFPGGMKDPEDGDLTETALRETFEEVGIEARAFEVLGSFPPLWTKTGFLVTPVLGLMNPPIEGVELKPSAIEIAETFWVGLDQLKDPKVYSFENFQAGGHTYPIHSFQSGPHRIWGVTGSIVKNLLDRLGAV